MAAAVVVNLKNWLMKQSIKIGVGNKVRCVACCSSVKQVQQARRQRNNNAHPRLLEPREGRNSFPKLTGWLAGCSDARKCGLTRKQVCNVTTATTIAGRFCIS